MTNRFRSANREVRVEDCKVERRKVAELTPLLLRPLVDQTSETWVVELTCRDGLLPTYRRTISCSSEEDAYDTASLHPVGSAFDSTTRAFQDPKNDFVCEMLIDTQVLLPPTRGSSERETELVSAVLQGAGIINDSRDLQPEISEFFSPDRSLALMKLHGIYWQVAAAFEYCEKMLPRSSLAYIAANCMFHLKISQDNFSAGYYLRDLEILFEEVEAKAVSEITRSKKAGAGSGKHSSGSRAKRRETLLEAFEIFASRNQGMVKYTDPKTGIPLLEGAVEIAKAANPTLWAQGQGQASQYIGEIRRGEAGPDLKIRYDNIFRSETA